MFINISILKNFLIFLLPCAIFLSMFLIAGSTYFQENAEMMSIGITLDLLLTAPLLYFISIRKTKIPKTTVLPVLVSGILVAYFILPSENQYYLNLFKTWAFPVIELMLVGFLFYKVRTVSKEFQRNQKETSDFFTSLKRTCSELLPAKLVMPMAMEIAVFYYGFLNWKKPSLNANEFTYHRQSGSIASMLVLFFLILVETLVIHILLDMWSSTAAWILTIISLYTAIQIFGLLRSMTKRPIKITEDVLHLKYGIMAESIIKLEDISEIEFTSGDLPDKTQKLSILGDLESHNMVIHLKNDLELEGLYGIKKRYRSIALFIDDQAAFSKMLSDRIGSLKSE